MSPRKSSPEPHFDRDEIAGLLTSIGGSHARRLTPVDVGKLLRREIRRGVTSARLAQELHLPPGTSVITWFLRLPDLPEEVQGLVQFGRPPAGLSLTQAAEVARLHPDESAMRRLAAMTIEHRFSGTETRSVVQLVKRRPTTVDAAVAEVLRGRPTIDRRHVLIGTVTPEAWSVLVILDEGAKQEALLGALRVLGVMPQAAHLSRLRYTVVLSDDEAARVRREGLTPDSLEVKLNTLLAEGLL